MNIWVCLWWRTKHEIICCWIVEEGSTGIETKHHQNLNKHMFVVEISVPIYTKTHQKFWHVHVDHKVTQEINRIEWHYATRLVLPSGKLTVCYWKWP
jgi:hypothetical protein